MFDYKFIDCLKNIQTFLQLDNKWDIYDNFIDKIAFNFLCFTSSSINKVTFENYKK